MKRPDNQSKPIPLHDYDHALQSAVSWLGDRYLLASPVPRRKEDQKPFFSEPRRWHETARLPSIARRH